MQAAQYCTCRQRAKGGLFAWPDMKPSSHGSRQQYAARSQAVRLPYMHHGNAWQG